MIISCHRCNKKFNIDSKAIPEKGRLLQCSSCSHKWFFKKNIINEQLIATKLSNQNKGIDKIENKSADTIELLDRSINNNPPTKKTLINNGIKLNEIHTTKNVLTYNKKAYNILGSITLFIISFVTLIIVVDTFKVPISKIIPNVEFMLYNLYESIIDIFLFFRNLI
jgi:predicted Zn finger-like uncharacterized protein